MDDKKIRKEDIKDDKLDMNCIPDEGKYKEGPFNPKDVPLDGSYKEHMSPKREDTATDIYYKTECKLPDSKVAIPTKDSVEEAKEWVDDENRK